MQEQSTSCLTIRAMRTVLKQQGVAPQLMDPLDQGCHCRDVKCRQPSRTWDITAGMNVAPA